MTASDGPLHIHYEATPDGGVQEFNHLFMSSDIRPTIMPSYEPVRVFVQPPSVNRAVHYHDIEYDGENMESRVVCRAAIVTDVFDHTDAYSPVGLAVFYRGVSFAEHVPYAIAEEKIPGTWHWAENVEPIEIVPIEAEDLP